MRDDLLPGGTKSVFLHKILDGDKMEYVYASPVYGGFQIALAAYCKEKGKICTIFCAKRKTPHLNSIRVKVLGGRVAQVPYGYLNVVQARAREYCEKNGAQYLPFGANSPIAIEAISHRMQLIINKIGREPDEIYCPVGSSILLQGIIKGSKTAKIIGIQVGADISVILPDRVEIIKYPSDFSKVSKEQAPFPSAANYDLKAWEYCNKLKKKGALTLFWNVLD